MYIILSYHCPAGLFPLPNLPLRFIPGLNARTTLGWMVRTRKIQATTVNSFLMNSRALVNGRMCLPLEAVALRCFLVLLHIPALPLALPLTLLLHLVVLHCPPQPHPLILRLDPSPLRPTPFLSKMRLPQSRSCSSLKQPALIANDSTATF